MVEVTGGRFWAPYRSDGAPKEAGGGAPAVAGMDPSLFRMRPPADLGNVRLRALAAGLGPAYMRVSGTWANSTYFHDSDEPAPATPPKGFGSVLTRAQWRGVVEFARAANARLVTSFAFSDGTRDAQGVWTSSQAAKWLAYTKAIGGSITAAEFFNEPNVAARGGAPAGYDAPAYARDFAVFRAFVRQAAPDLLLIGPGSVSEGGMLANFPGGIKSEDMLTATGPGLDGVSYHYYGAVSQRCGRPGTTIGQTTPEVALSEDWLSRTERDARFAAALRDRFEPGKPLWLTETGETGCGGNPWASTFTDTFRYVEQLGRLARLGVQVVMHNTLAASDYALIDEETLEPRPSYWASVLWRRLMGTTVLDAGPSPAPGVDLFAHCLAGARGGVGLVAVNTDRTAARDLSIGTKWDRYTLTASSGLQSRAIELNGTPLVLAQDGTRARASGGVARNRAPDIAAGEHHLRGVAGSGEHELPVGVDRTERDVTVGPAVLLLRVVGRPWRGGGILTSRPSMRACVSRSRSRCRHPRQRCSGESLFDEACQEIGERLDVFSDAGALERGHVGLPPGDRDHGPRVASRRHHQVHQEASHAPVAVHVRVDVDEHEVAEHDTHGGARLFMQQVEEHWHRVQHDIAVRRYVHGLPDVDRAIAIASQVGGPEQAGGHAWREHLPVPRPVILPCDARCIFAREHPADTVPH